MPSPVCAVQFWQYDSGLWDVAGSGWQASAGVEPAILTLHPALDLRSMSNPKLSFQTLVVSAYSSANIEVSFDGVTWMPVAILSASDTWQTAEVDLHAYRGQMIYLRFVWLSRLPQPDDVAMDMWLLDEVRIENMPTPTALPTGITPTATSVPTEVPTTEPTENPTEAPTSEPTTLPTPTEAIPAEEVPLNAAAPSR